MIYPIKLRKMCESLIYNAYKNNQLNSVKDLCDFIKENKYSGMEENKLIPFNYTHETMNKSVFNKLLDLPKNISNKDEIYDELVDLYIESKSNSKLSEDILLSILSKEELNSKTIKKLLKNDCIFSEKTLDIIINKDGEKVYKYKDKQLCRGEEKFQKLLEEDETLRRKLLRAAEINTIGQTKKQLSRLTENFYPIDGDVEYESFEEAEEEEDE